MIAAIRGIAKTVSTPRVANKIVKALFANCIAELRPSVVTLLPNNGTKAALKAPSPKIRRNIFGKRKAAKKASATTPVPKNLAIKMSRTTPKIRLIKVNPEIVIKERSMREGEWIQPAPSSSKALSKGKKSKAPSKMARTTISAPGPYAGISHPPHSRPRPLPVSAPSL